MRELNNLEDLFRHQLRDIYNAENQLIGALPTMIENSSSEWLKEAFEEHLEETRGHKHRLEEIGQSLGIDLAGEVCNAMEGLIEEAEEFINANPALDVKDAGIIADAQRIEHYEISAYGTAVTFAEALGHHNAARKLQQTLDEESAADSRLNELAIESVNPRAKTV